MQHVVDAFDRIPLGADDEEVFASFRRELLEASMVRRSPWMALIEVQSATRALLGSEPAYRETARARTAAAQLVVDEIDKQDGRTWPRRMQWMQSPEEFRSFFEIVGLEGEDWRNVTNYQSRGGQYPEDKAKDFRLIYKHLLTRFGGHGNFRRWMDSPVRADADLLRRVRVADTREEFRRLIGDLRIDDLWREGMPAAKRLAEESVEKHRHENRAKFVDAILRDARFRNSYPRFLEWMDGARQREDTFVSRIGNCDEPEDFIALFRDLGIPGDKWRDGGWLMTGAKLPPEEGGIGVSLSGLHAAIMNDERFLSFRKFLHWIDRRPRRMSIAERVRHCPTQKHFRELFAQLGIPGDAWRSPQWLTQTSKLAPPEGIGVSMVGVHKAIMGDERFGGGDYRRFLAWMDGSELALTMKERVDACIEPADFLGLFAALGIPEGKWFDYTWMHKTSVLPPDAGGIGVSMANLRKILCDRFKGMRKFRAFMGVAETEETPIIRQVEACLNPEDFAAMFAGLGVPGAKWKDRLWLKNVSRLPAAEGGIGKNLAGYFSAIIEDERFGAWKPFVAFIEGREHEEAVTARVLSAESPAALRVIAEELQLPDEILRQRTLLWQEANRAGRDTPRGRMVANFTRALKRRWKGHRAFRAWFFPGAPARPYTERSRECETPGQMRVFLEEQHIPETLWRSSTWWNGRRTSGVISAIKQHPKLTGSHPRFVAWMDGVELPPPVDYRAMVKGWTTPDDAKASFAALGAPPEAWRRSKWITETARKPVAEGGLGCSLNSLYVAIKERFEAYVLFVLWMQGKTRSFARYSTKARSCTEPAHFLAWFAELGIPGTRWRSSNWLSSEAKLPPPQGIGLKLAGLTLAIKGDPRFENSWPNFLAFMDGKPVVLSMQDRVDACEKREDYLALFVSLGIPEGKWRTTNWLENGAKKPPAEGGVGRTLQGLSKALRAKFKGFAKFLEFMDGKKKEPTAWETVKDFTRREQYLELFRTLGVPDEEWRAYNWLSETAKLAPPEGIGRNLSAIASAISRKFDRNYKAFIAFMDGAEIPKTWAQRVAAADTPAKMLELLHESGVPVGSDCWHESTWMTKKSRLAPPAGIGVPLAGLQCAIKDDPRFKASGYPAFLDWMAGVPLGGIRTDGDAHRLLRATADLLKVEVGEMLRPDSLRGYMQRSRLLQRVMEYFGRQTDDVQDT